MLRAFSTIRLFQQNSIAASKEFIPAMTGLRALAAFLVFFSHFPIPSKRAGSFVTEFCSELYVGVSIFFVLSGFLISLRYSKDFNYSLKGVFIYMKKRFARIYPMYFILTTLTFLYPKIESSFIPTTYFLSVPGANSFDVYILNITFLRGFFADVALSGIGQGWTLTVEECFYILAPLIFLLRRKVPLVVHLMLLYATGFVLVFLFNGADYLGFFASNKFVLITTFFGRCLEFYIGIQLASWYQKDQTQMPGRRYTAMGVLGMFILVCCLVFTKDENQDYYYGLYSWPGLIINNFLVPFAIGILFMGLLKEKTFLRKILESNFTILLGKSSYVFYLIHLGLISELLYQFVTHNYLLNFPLLVALSIFLFRFLESPLNNLIRRL